MALTTAERDRIWAAWMRSVTADQCAFTKADLRAAVDAADDWATANASSYNTALPTAFRTNATAAQKAYLLAYICFLRAGLRPPGDS